MSNGTKAPGECGLKSNLNISTEREDSNCLQEILGVAEGSSVSSQELLCQKPRPDSCPLDLDRDLLGRSHLTKRGSETVVINVALWSCEDVVMWLAALGFDASICHVFRTQRVNGEVLLTLTEHDYKEELGIVALGDRRRLSLAIKRLQSPSLGSLSPGSSSHSCSPTSPQHSPVTHHHYYHRHCCLDTNSHSGGENCNEHGGGGENTNGADSGIGGGDGEGSVAGGGGGKGRVWCSCRHHKSAPSPHMLARTLLRHHKRRTRYSSSESDDENDDEGDDDMSIGCRSSDSTVTTTSQAATGRTAGLTTSPPGATNGGRRGGNLARTVPSGGRAPLQPEYLKTAISCFYMFLVTWITAIVMVFVHDRVPDRDRHPPLPDIFLDNVPHIPWAFQLCELTIIVLLCTFLCILCFHKHRCIIVRRFAALGGTVFLLRCATMFITSLSVPGNHLQCSPREQRSIWRQVEQAWVIWQGGGLSIKGVRTCGDYMFSGHTTALTMLNFFITEYTPRRLYYIHIASWVLNMFGIFFVLAAHEHYSIDVFIAFYITSRMFLYYHSLANNRALHQKDSFRTKIWFPMFSYFESSIEGIVPNEYSNLFAWSNLLWAANIILVPLQWIACKSKITLIAMSGVPGWKDIVGVPKVEQDDGSTGDVGDGTPVRSQQSSGADEGTNVVNGASKSSNSTPVHHRKETTLSGKHCPGSTKDKNAGSAGTLHKHSSGSKINLSSSIQRKDSKKKVL
ncbi:uncharacterized protein LOC108677452 [Hyalella azteca]|uniref:Uncharacterized protein LOC108677452 n=1 Tax=Hyalella azteca TaxID=294128 RepID=A0A8B7P7N7_HYAAZ|nr:uncharacterized protein LOC108677452 [Hyalella azteca]